MAHDESFGRNVIDGDEVEDVLSGRFYSPRIEPSRAGEKASRPAHYKVICISMYTKDLARLDDLVGELKSRGLTKANRSALIRAALAQVDLDRIPRGI
jgi:hypothetical protein